MVVVERNHDCTPPTKAVAGRKKKCVMSSSFQLLQLSDFYHYCKPAAPRQVPAIQPQPCCCATVYPKFGHSSPVPFNRVLRLLSHQQVTWYHAFPRHACLRHLTTRYPWTFTQGLWEGQQGGQVLVFLLTQKFCYSFHFSNPVAYPVTCHCVDVWFRRMPCTPYQHVCGVPAGGGHS